jgi:hypothetical protein
VDSVIVVVVSLLVGGIVYAITLWNGRRDEQAFGFGEPEERSDPATAPEPGYAYLKVVTTGTSWRSRIQGFVGLLVLLAASAAVLALGIYQLGHLINQVVERFLVAK